MSDDDRINTANRLGARVTYPHAVSPTRDRYGAPWCPVCCYALKDPEPIDPRSIQSVSEAFAAAMITNARLITLACPSCRQILDWSTWPTTLSPEEMKTHEEGGCREWRPCPRCQSCWPSRRTP